MSKGERELEPERINKAGYVTKQGRIIRNWKRRWFVLQNDKIYYYVNEKTPKPRGVIHLVNATVLDYTTNASECGFDINTPKRVWHIIAETIEERDLWVQAIRERLRINGT
eukprot:Phypoly_transcript_22770.p1 GENE.Phypoly_transcript_22770~~Phypoly_transcript_22770.p1  ORF type:complete len:121 (+),score=1.70 Phypoly_transcript_22770:31-363(+)